MRRQQDASERQAAFDRMWRELMPQVLAFLERRVASRDDALDLTSEVFLTAWNKLDPSDENARAWLFTTAWNKLSVFYRRSQRGARAMEAITREAILAADSLDINDRITLRDAVSTLPAREQQMVLLYYWDGLPADEIATVLSCKPGAVWTALSRARARMRTRLEADESRLGKGDTVEAHG